MCLAVYLAADQPVPIIPWQETAPAFYTEATAILSSRLPALSRPCHYYLGSHQGCGCGFSTDGIVADLPEYQDVQRTYQQLAAFLEREIRTGSAEIFVCWEGEETREPLRRLHAQPMDLYTMSITLQEGDFLTITLGGNV